MGACHSQSIEEVTDTSSDFLRRISSLLLHAELRFAYELNLGIVFGILDYSVDYSASSDIRLMTKIRILYSAVFVYSVL